VIAICNDRDPGQRRELAPDGFFTLAISGDEPAISAFGLDSAGNRVIPTAFRPRTHGSD
jgi:hypothetical protein